MRLGNQKVSNFEFSSAHHNFCRAPSWMNLNQNTGVLSGTAVAFVGTSADTITVNCKAGNAIGGTVNFTVTVTVAEAVSSYGSTTFKEQKFNKVELRADAP